MYVDIIRVHLESNSSRESPWNSLGCCILIKGIKAVRKPWDTRGSVIQMFSVIMSGEGVKFNLEGYLEGARAVELRILTQRCYNLCVV
eukprot:1300386-Amorphochlora_amoeboformis.AAC.1